MAEGRGQKTEKFNNCQLRSAVCLHKLYPDGLIKQPRLLTIRFTCKALQAKQAGRVALIDGYFEITGRIKERELFAFFNMCISFRYHIDHLIPFEDDFKAPAPALLLELVVCDVDDNILEMIYK